MNTQTFPTVPSLVEAFREDVLFGLSQRQRTLQPRWFYDHRGSELFEAITRLPEYYPTRCEGQILQVCGDDMARLVGRDRTIVEFGSGASVKTRLLIGATQPKAYVPIDISGDFLREAAADVAQRFPGLKVVPLEADFSHPVVLPSETRGPYLGFFPGSTIGNLLPADAVDLLRRMADLLGSTSMLLIGIDRLKDATTLVQAYDDAASVTAAFNLNLLERINRELDGSIPVEAFRHKAVWNAKNSRIEMHLEAIRDIRFSVGSSVFGMAAGQTIHTENSHKYDPHAARVLLSAGRWVPVREWTDPQGLFSVYLVRAATRSDREG